jgi:hypothetical protein
MALTNHVKFYAATNINPQHHKTVPTGHNTPAPSVGKYWPNNNGDKAEQYASNVVTH